MLEEAFGLELATGAFAAVFGALAFDSCAGFFVVFGSEAIAMFFDALLFILDSVYSFFGATFAFAAAFRLFKSIVFLSVVYTVVVSVTTVMWSALIGVSNGFCWICELFVSETFATDTAADEVSG